eukprot:TRINITY_DN9887_c0_g1_i1.p1 TRINITY_DN9887_c0_g1~~TRINITY_DN9887_c0_g1_i1.p1  ORF type:complete len:103 (+),score=18.49 TRINITY_DN9887_c0_g1_i1:28-336(+)
MRQAMASCEVGDDVLQEDPTVRELEVMSAKLLGKEEAIFVASGAMGNLISILVHCPRRDSEIIAGDQSHILYYEQGSAATLGEIGRAVQQECRDRSRMPSSA